MDYLNFYFGVILSLSVTQIPRCEDRRFSHRVSIITEPLYYGTLVIVLPKLVLLTGFEDGVGGLLGISGGRSR